MSFAADAGRRESRRQCLRLSATCAVAGLSLVPLLGRAAKLADAPDRRALVIGNGDYEQAPLKNAKADAKLVSVTLRDMGFQVQSHTDMPLQAMLDAILAFLQSATTSAVRFIYFSGHGAQYRGRNYLLPVDAVLKSEDDLPARAVDGTGLIERVSGLPAGANILVFDACRSVPMRARTRTLQAQSQGMSEVLSPSGTLVGFSTAPNRVASDGPDRRNSLYTQTLCEELRKPGVPIETVFKRVRQTVAQDSGGQQVPWESSSLVGELCFNQDASLSCAARDARGTVVRLR